MALGCVTCRSWRTTVSSGVGQVEASVVEIPASAASRPVVFVVDDEPGVARAVERDLRSHLRDRYRVLRAEPGAQALEAGTSGHADAEERARFESHARQCLGRTAEP
jgi:hypothetical protein